MKVKFRYSQDQKCHETIFTSEHTKGIVSCFIKNKSKTNKQKNNLRVPIAWKTLEYYMSAPNVPSQGSPLSTALALPAMKKIWFVRWALMMHVISEKSSQAAYD